LINATFFNSPADAILSGPSGPVPLNGQPGYAPYWLLDDPSAGEYSLSLKGMGVNGRPTTALIAFARVMWQRPREGDAPPRPLVGKAVQQLVWCLVAAAVLLIGVGTVVTGAGPHAGDSSEVNRIPLDWETITKLHAVLAWIVVTLAFALWFVLKAVDAPQGPLHRTRELFLILLGQGVIGYVQYFTDLPEALVAVHMLGSCLVWIGVLRVLLSLRERPVPDLEIPGPTQAGSSVGAGV